MVSALGRQPIYESMRPAARAAIAQIGIATGTTAPSSWISPIARYSAPPVTRAPFG